MMIQDRHHDNIWVANEGSWVKGTWKQGPHEHNFEGELVKFAQDGFGIGGWVFGRGGVLDEGVFLTSPEPIPVTKSPEEQANEVLANVSFLDALRAHGRRADRGLPGGENIGSADFMD